jgi:hypothetical protein
MERFADCGQSRIFTGRICVINYEDFENNEKEITIS